MSLDDIVKRFPGVLALDHASLGLRHGEIHGLIGENGAGKSTIIKVLGGLLRADEGTIRIGGAPVDHPTPALVHSLGIRIVHQELALVPTLTVAESVFLDQEIAAGPLTRTRRMRHRAARFLEDSLGMRIPATRLIRDLDPAERKLVQIAHALVDGDARVVILDEPTAPLAATQVSTVFTAIRRLRDSGVAILYVSHYLSEIQEICDRATVLRAGRTVGVAEKKDLASSDRLIEMMIGRRIDEVFPPAHRVPAGTPPILEATGIAIDDAVEPIDLDLAPGEIVGVAGLPGSGRDALVDALAGMRAPTHGRLAVAGKILDAGSRTDAARHGIGLVPRDRRGSGVVLNLSTAANLTLASLRRVSHAGVLDAAAEQTQADTTITALDIRPVTASTPTRLLSGGNQQKVVLGRWIATQSPILILEEPTVGVDVSAKSEIYRIIAHLAEQGTAVLISSNDTEELWGLAHRVLVMRRGRLVADVDTSAADPDRLLALVTGLSDEPEEETAP